MDSVGLIVGIGVFLVFLGLALVFVLKLLKATEDEDSRYATTAHKLGRGDNFSKEQTASQLQVLVSSARVSGSYARDEVTRQSLKNTVSDLRELTEIKNILEVNLEYLTSVMGSTDSYVLPVASGRASKLQLIGGRIFTIVKDREATALELAKTTRDSSTRIKELIRKPYVIKSDVYTDLVGSGGESIIEWTSLSAWVKHFELEVKEVRLAIEKRSKFA